MAWTNNSPSAGRRELATGEAIVFSELVDNDISKDLVFDTDVKRGVYLEITGVRVELTAGVTAGTRALTLSVLEGGDVVREIPALATQAASGSTTFEFFVGLDAETVNGIAVESLPPGVRLTSGQTFRVAASAGTPAEDSMFVHLTGLSR